MSTELIRGNKALAECLGVSFKTVYNWKNRGLLDKAMVVNCGRVIVYDFNKVCECLRQDIQPVRQSVQKIKTSLRRE